MSMMRQQPEHLIIRDYVGRLRDRKAITQEQLRDAFVSVYLEMIPPGDDVPGFELVHRFDSVEVMRRKNGANLKKLWRAIDGGTSFPLAFKAPLIVALDNISKSLGLELQKMLLHNAGLLHLPIDTSGKAPVIYAEWLQEVADANIELVADANDDGVLNGEKTEKEVIDVIEKSYQLLGEIRNNKEAGNGCN